MLVIFLGAGFGKPSMKELTVDMEGLVGGIGGALFFVVLELTMGAKCWQLLKMF